MEQFIILVDETLEHPEVKLGRERGERRRARGSERERRSARGAQQSRVAIVDFSRLLQLPEQALRS